MNFFEQQDIAHRNTKWLIILLCCAVVSLIAITTLLVACALYYFTFDSQSAQQDRSIWYGITHSISWNMFAAISIGVCAVVFLGSVFKFKQLSSGGRAVAEALGGRLINIHNANADEKKILNVVEEMAIASGTPVPPVYILEDEAINAFAAGHNPQDAIIGVTRGCIRLLSRDELQGVIAHEFSHIFHGDMRLNMRLVALLNGILLLGLIGEFLLRSSGYRSSFRSSKGKSPAGLLALGLGLIIIGYAGTFFGNLIKAAVSRQREFLADASAVKFTRNPQGISGALKKLGGYVGGSQLDLPGAAEFSHLFFGEGTHMAFNALATHPPLKERIKRIDPSWNGTFKLTNVHEEEDVSQSTYDGTPLEFTSPTELLGNSLLIDQALQSIGKPNQAHFDYAKETLDYLPEKLHQAAHNPWEAQAMLLGLLLDKNPDELGLQLSQLRNLFSNTQYQSLVPWAMTAAAVAPELRLPLVELSLPTLKNLSHAQYVQFKCAMNALIRHDGPINLVEWSLFKIITQQLEPKKMVNRLIDLSQLKSEACILLTVMAKAGTTSTEAAQVAFDLSKKTLGLTEEEPLRETNYTTSDLDVVVNRLNCIKPLQKPKLLKALSQCILADEQITVAEAELFRAIAEILNCPIPPMIIKPTQ